MWCSNCRQDVPGIAASSDAAASENAPLCCIRCSSVLLAGAESRPGRAEARPPLADAEDESDRLIEADPFDDFGAWELEERLRHVKRLVSGANDPLRRAPSLNGLRIDAAQTLNLQQGAAEAPVPASPLPGDHAGTWGSFFSWSAIALGLAATTCGGVLTAWSYAAADRHDLREIGLPTLLGGLLCLVIGLLLQLRVARRSEGRLQGTGASLVAARASDTRSATIRIDSTLSDAF